MCTMSHKGNFQYLRNKILVCQLVNSNNLFGICNNKCFCDYNKFLAKNGSNC